MFSMISMIWFLFWDSGQTLDLLLEDIWSEVTPDRNNQTDIDCVKPSKNSCLSPQTIFFS